jgi:outer membrane lipoprotein-sorting protein
MAPLAFHFTHYRSLPMNHPATARLCAGLLALAFAGQAAADARSELHAAFQKNLSAKTYRSTITDLATNQQVSTVEFQAPDRYRISANGMNSVIANGKMYMTVNGKAMAMPLPPGTLEKFRSDAAWKQMESETLISNAGAGAIGGELVLKYHWITSGKHPSTGDVWVSKKSGYVVQVETSEAKGSKRGAVRVRYSDFNSAAIKISPPKA